ncbi:MAG: hypothetical protein ABWY06_19965 [Pseudomonas sp.]|uniref:hypothetical protein n=1 Tax=Pseudomonas sp. TaxID=306 RepID=UPI003397EC37
MNFKTISKAKEYVIFKTNKNKSIEDINIAIAHYQEMTDNARNEESKSLWIDELNELIKLKQSEDFKNGKFPQGIDELIIELIEWRSAIFAFQNTDTKTNPFKYSSFYSQWYVGAIYGIFSIFGKLLSTDKRDNSLRKLWDETSPSMLEDGACVKAEYDYINLALHLKSGRFTNENSQTILYRNKLISHNEQIPIVKWDEIDKDFSFMIRIWSLLISWSSFGLLDPFRSGEEAFLGIESMFDRDEIKSLKEKRQLYLKTVERWSKTYVHSGEEDLGRGVFSSPPFVNISSTSTIKES